MKKGVMRNASPSSSKKEGAMRMDQSCQGYVRVKDLHFDPASCSRARDFKVVLGYQAAWLSIGSE